MKKSIKDSFVKLGVDYNRVINFLKVECKIDLGFEAQLVGTKARSATTTGLILYVLAFFHELTKKEKKSLLKEIDSFKTEYGGFGDIYGTTYPCSWATAQILLALMETGESHTFVKASLEALINRFQMPSGGWCFSGTEDVNLIYSIYPIIALKKAYAEYSINRPEVIRNTVEYLLEYSPDNESEKIIILGLLSYIKNNFPNAIEFDVPIITVNYELLLKKEFGTYGVNEYTVYPFSMKIYTPALYLLSRNFTEPNHPFSLYLIRYLLSNIVDGKMWRLVAPRSSKKPCSFCTALSILTVYHWLVDSNKKGFDIQSILSNENTLEKSLIRLEQMHTKIHIFISYSSKDETVTTEVVKRLKSMGFDVKYAELDLLVGDSIPGYINEGLRKMDYFLLFLSPSSVKSKFVTDEFESAKAKEWNQERVIILPVLLEKCEVPPIIATKKWADFSLSFEDGMKTLVESIRKHHARKK